MRNKPSKIVQQGFDTLGLKNRHLAEKMYKDPVIKKFFALITTTYEVNIPIDYARNLEFRNDYNNQLKDELYNVLSEHIDQQKNPQTLTKNESSKRYTADFAQAHREQLYELGLHIEQKYGIKTMKTQEGKDMYKAQTLIRIGDIEKFLGFFSHVSILTKDIVRFIGAIHNETCKRLNKNLLEHGHFPDNDEEMKKFFGGCEALNQRYTWLGLRDYFQNDEIKSYLMAYKTDGLREYTAFLKLGFVGCLFKQIERAPTFISSIIITGQSKQHNTLLLAKEALEDVAKAISLLEKIKYNKTVFYPLIDELQRGLYDAIIVYQQEYLDKNILRQLIAYEETVDSMIEDAFSRE